MDKKRHITRKILLAVNLVMVFGAMILKIVNPVVVSYTDEIRRADIINFTLFTPVIMIILSLLLYRSLKPVRALYETGRDLSLQQLQELRTAAFNLPVKTLFLFNLVTLSIVAFVALGVDAVFFKFYPFYKRLISMGLIWTYTICSSLAVYAYAKQLMVPILRMTSGAAGDEGYRVSIKTNIIVTTLMLSATIFLFLSVYGYSQAREAFGHDDEDTADSVFYSLKNRMDEFKDEQELKKYVGAVKSGVKVFLLDSEGIYLTDKPDIIPDTFDAKRLISTGSKGTVSFNSGVHNMTFKVFPLGKPFDDLYVGTVFEPDPVKQQKTGAIAMFFVIMSGFFLLFSGAISYYVANDTSMTVKNIEKRMRKISAEEEKLFEEIEVISLDEAGDLTRAFNNLQRTIRSRNHELDTANKKLLEMERREARKALEASEERYRLLAENVTDVIWTTDMGLRYTYVSPSVTALLGYTVDEALPLTPSEIFTPASYVIAMKAFEEEMAVEAAGQVDPLRSRIMEFEHVKKDGSLIWVEVMMTFLRDSEGRPMGIVGVTRDITERKKLEEQLRHSQKMEAVGTLTGGIAHDFNNILTTIMNCGNILKMKMGKDEPLRTYVSQILAASERAANLTNGLLSFSRKQIIKPRPVRLNDIVIKVEKLLHMILGENIGLNIMLAEEDLTVVADSGQIEQVLMNLCTNARDAMPGGGMLTIKTELAELDAEFRKTHGYGKPGLYAVISVADTGTGMDEKTRERIFEPFFTTKDVGKGTGLGLSIAYGIIRQHNGYINCDSETGKGTTFKAYLPLTGSVCEETESAADIALLHGSETVLVAEDDSDVRVVTKDMLEEFGYKVLEATDGEDAVNKFIENKDRIGFLLFDVKMPKKNGKEAYDEIKKIRPDIKALFLSGYAEDIINKERLYEDGINILAKPVPPTELLRKMRELLDR
ncbi:MAG: ATP-binding protein [Thermodesulfovibrionales bacterium]